MKLTKEERDLIFEMAVTTMFTTVEIKEFVWVTGIKVDRIKKILKQYDSCGMHTLRDVITIAKLGQFDNRGLI